MEVGRLQCQLTVRRVREEEAAILEAMFSCTVCVLRGSGCTTVV